MSIPLVFLLLALLVLSCNGRYLRNYPNHLITKHSFGDKTIFKIPYCHSSFCKTSVDEKTNIRLRSSYKFQMDLSLSGTNFDLQNSYTENYRNGMYLILSPKKKIRPKKHTFKLDNLEFSDDDIEIIDVPSFENYTKNKDAVSGYLNKRNEWIRY